MTGISIIIKTDIYELYHIKIVILRGLIMISLNKYNKRLFFKIIVFFYSIFVIQCESNKSNVHYTITVETPLNGIISIKPNNIEVVEADFSNIQDFLATEAVTIDATKTVECSEANRINCIQRNLAAGSEIIFTAIHSADYHFVSWGNDCSNITDTTCILNLNKNIMISALFESD